MIPPSENPDAPSASFGSSLPVRFGISVFLLYIFYEFVVEAIVERLFELDHVEHISEKWESVLAVGVVLLLAGFMARRIEREKEQIASRLAASEERLSRITDATQDAIVMVDGEFNITFWSASAERLFALSREEVLGSPIAETLTPPAQQDELIQWLTQLREGNVTIPQGTVFSVTPMRKGRRLFAAEVTLSPLVIDGSWNAVAVVRDATKQRRVQRRLERARNRAEQAVLEKERYVSLIVHDLKGPFGAMITMLEMFQQELAEHPENRLNDRFHRPVTQLTKSARTALGMVEKVLLSQKIKQGGMPIDRRRFNAYDQAEETISLHRQMAAIKGVELVNEIPPKARLYGDPGLFLEVLNNLVANAIKFCRTNDRITLALPDEGSGVSVTDTGVGIDDAHFESLFDEKHRVSSIGTAGERGHGFGLPLAARIMEAHEGRLTAKRRPEGGSVFYAQLPQPTKCALVACQADSSICVAHDVLEEMGIDVQRYKDKEEALAFLEGGIPDLVISGRIPARGEGFDDTIIDACRELRRSQVPIIVCNKRVRKGCALRNHRGDLPPEVSEGLRKRINEHLLSHPPDTPLQK